MTTTTSPHSFGQPGVVAAPEPVVSVYQLDSLPLAALGYVGQKVSLSTLLTDSFGTDNPSGFRSFTLENVNHNQPKGYPGQDETSYWGYEADAHDSYWLVNGQPITSTVTIDAANIDDVELVVGNSMMNTVRFSVPVSRDASDNTQLYRTYNIWTTQFEVEGAQFKTGDVDPIDIVTSAYLFNSKYPIWLNENNCNWIADDLAAAAGAVMPYDNYSDFPRQNVSGGFWRVVYRGDGPNGVQDWSTLTKPGDIVRMVWANGSGHHTTTVVGEPLADGSLPVYDNDLQTSTSSHIGVHHAWYWNETSIEGTTIFRLAENHKYLITGTDGAEFLQGTVFDDLFIGSAGADAIDGSIGVNTVSFARSASGVTVNLTTDVNTGGDAEGDNLTNIQNVTGSKYQDSLTGDASNNILYGKGGGDALYGMDGNDRLIIDDTPTLIDGGSGADVLIVQGGAAIVLTDATFQNVERVVVRNGTSLDMSAIGSGVMIHSQSEPGQGVTIIGTAGDDRIQAGQGGDWIDGGMGADRLLGGSGADTFVFSADFGQDDVYGFDLVLDRLDVSALAQSFSDLQIRSVRGGGSAEITFLGDPDPASKIVLHDVVASSLTPGSFLF